MQGKSGTVQGRCRVVQGCIQGRVQGEVHGEVQGEMQREVQGRVQWLSCPKWHCEHAGRPFKRESADSKSADTWY